jgi:hypothetical protein
MESMLDNNKSRRRHELIEEELDISTPLEASLKKKLQFLVPQYGLAKSTAHIGMNLLKLQPY